jgi:hypothetical protein
MGHDSKVVQKLPLYLQYTFPAILTKKAGICTKLLQLVKSLVPNGLGFSNVRDIIDEIQHLEYDISQIKYYDLCTSIIEKQESKKTGFSNLFNISSSSTSTKLPKKFGKFSNLLGYGGLVPSTNYIQKLYIEHHKSVRPWMDSKVCDIQSKMLKIDHTFSLPEYIGLGGGEKLFHALFTAMNEYGEIRLQFFAPTKGFTQLQGVFDSFKQTCIDRSYQLPQIIYTDNCCGDRNFISQAALGIQTQKQSQYPPFEIPEAMKPIIVSRGTFFEELSELLLEEQIEQLAIDAEWNYSEHSGPEKVAIIQITDGKKIWIIQMHKIKDIPDAFEQIIFSESIKKVGLKINSDIRKLFRDWKPSKPSCQTEAIPALVDIANLAKIKRKTANATLGLQELTEKILHMSLDKSLRHSNWEANELTDDLIQYAASDVLASYQIFEALQNMSDKIRLTSTPQNGTLVSIMTLTGDTVVAIGTSVSKEAANYSGKLKLTKNRAFVRIERILAPSAIVGVEKIALSTITCLPFTALLNAWELSTEITSTELDSNTITAISPHLPEINNEPNTTNVEEDDDESLEEQDLEPEVSEQISALEKISLIAMEDNTAYSAEMLNPIFNVYEEKKLMIQTKIRIAALLNRKK